jgi:hypothetical protein
MRIEFRKETDVSQYRLFSKGVSFLIKESAGLMNIIRRERQGQGESMHCSYVDMISNTGMILSHREMK